MAENLEPKMQVYNYVVARKPPITDTNATIARFLQISIAEVSRAIAVLKAEGRLQVEQRVYQSAAGGFRGPRTLVAREATPGIRAPDSKEGSPDRLRGV
jgi:hypothetical protein